MIRLKLLITNIGFFGGLKVVSSLFPLLILPYVTSQLESAEDFGVYDMFTVIKGLGASIAMLGVQESMFRQFHLKTDLQYRKNVITTGFIIITISAVVMGFLILVLKGSIQTFLFNDPEHYSVIYFAGLFVITQNLLNIAVHPSRLENNKWHLLINTLSNAIVFYVIVLVLLHYSFGLFALVYGHIFSTFALASFFIFLNRKSFFPIRFSKDIARNLLWIGLPLIPIFMIYQANNSVVRIFIMKYLGAVELGVFSIGSKYASVSTFLQMAFAGGWSFFTFSTMKDADQIKIKAKIFDTLLFFITLSYFLVVPLAPDLFEYLFSGDYVRGYTVFGQLFLAPLFLMLYQIIANQFTIAGKSYYSLISLTTGFVISVFLAYIFLENGLGIVPVSYSIPISYFIAIIVSYSFAVKLGLFKISGSSLWSVIFIIIVSLGIEMEHSAKIYIYLSPFLLIYLYFRRKLILEFYLIGKQFFSKRE